MVLYSTRRFQGEVTFFKGALDPVGKSGMGVDINIWDSGHNLIVFSCTLMLTVTCETALLMNKRPRLRFNVLRI